MIRSKHIQYILFFFSVFFYISVNGQTTKDVYFKELKDMQLDATGRLWLLDKLGNLSTYNGQTIEPFPHSIKARNLIKSDGNIYIFDLYKVYVLDELASKFEEIHDYRPFEIKHLGIEEQRLFALLDNGFVKIDEEEVACIYNSGTINKHASYYSQYVDNQWYFAYDTLLLSPCHSSRVLFSLPSQITGLITDGRDHLVISTLSDGLYKVSNGILTKQGFTKPIYSDSITQIRRFENEYFFQTDHAVYSRNTITSEMERPFLGHNLTLGFVNNNGLWYIGRNSFTHPKNDTHYPMQLVSLKEGTKQLNSGQRFVFKPDHKPLRFSFSHINWNQNVNYEYQYKLGNKSWKKFDIDDEIYVEKLPIGNHMLEVKGTTKEKSIYLKPSLEIQILAPKVPSWWKYVFGLLALLFLLSILSWIRIRNLNSKHKKEKEAWALKQNIQSEQLRAMQLQMNPHFVFNALNSIGGLIALKENSQARKYLNQFSQLMRSQLNQSKDLSITIEQEVQLLENYLALEMLCHQDKFDYSIKVIGIKSQTNVPSMLIQPFVENAIKHGIRWKEKKGHISIQFKPYKNHIMVEIDDNGVGRSFAQSKKEKGHHSIAIDVVKNRISAYLPFVKKENIVLFVDKQENGVASGTTVSIHLPILQS